MPMDPPSTTGDTFASCDPAQPATCYFVRTDRANRLQTSIEDPSARMLTLPHNTKVPLDGGKDGF